MNLLLFSAKDRNESGQLQISDSRLQHLLEIHGKGNGDSVRVGEINGDVGHATIISIDESAAILETTLSQAPPAKLPLTLIVALPRPKMLRRILRSVAEFGVNELHLINSYRVEKSFWQTPVLQDHLIEQYLLQGLEQSRDTQLPTIHQHKRFKPFVEDDLPDVIQGKQALLAHPGDYPSCPRGVTGPTLVVIGPEGGFIPYEVAMLERAGCQAVSLGPRILRVENAVTSLMGRLF
ncbi:MAG: 16S rRNA (uracil(1498)-N(3))-methyltransferase [Halioglobus sp.]